MNEIASTARLRFVIREEPLPANYMPRKPMDSPELMYQFFKEIVETDESFEENKEHLVIVLLDTRLRNMGYQVVSVGTLTQASAHPREIFRPVILKAAYGFGLMHNHPSGDPSPSRQDEVFTRRLIEAAELMDLRFLDHVVVGSSEAGRQPYYSFREAGIIV